MFLFETKPSFVTLAYVFEDRLHVGVTVVFVPSLQVATHVYEEDWEYSIEEAPWIVKPLSVLSCSSVIVSESVTVLGDVFDITLE